MQTNNIPDFVNLSNFFALMAGFLAVFLGSKNFRQGLYSFLHKRSIESEKIYDAIKSRLTTLDIPAIHTRNIKSSQYLRLELLDWLSTLIKKRSPSYLVDLKYPLKVTFFYSFVYCIFYLLLIGVRQYIDNNDVVFQLLIFFNNILLLNTLIFLTTIFFIKRILIGKYLLMLTALFFFNYFITSVLNYSPIALSKGQYLLISIITPVSPFIYQLLLEFISYLILRLCILSSMRIIEKERKRFSEIKEQIKTISEIESIIDLDKIQ